MKSLWTAWQAWFERRRQKRHEWWERKRAGGKLRYVLWFTMIWSGAMIVALSLPDYFLDRKLDTGALWFTVIYFLVSGVVLGLWAWSTNEKNYHSWKARMARTPAK